MKYLVNFEIVKQGFSEIVEANDKEQALEKAKQYLENRFLDLKSNDTVTEIHEGRSGVTLIGVMDLSAINLIHRIELEVLKALRFWGPERLN